jgi:hypothetical protein
MHSNTQALACLHHAEDYRVTFEQEHSVKGKILSAGEPAGARQLTAHQVYIQGTQGGKEGQGPQQGRGQG